MPEALHVFTCAAVNYLPKVRILCQSVRRNHPEAVIHFVLADERPGWLTTEGEPFDEILEARELGIRNWRAWSFTHDIVELSTAVKPFALRRLLQKPDCATVLYFDPDVVLFSRVDDILEALATANVVLTPHQNKPEATLEAVLDNEVASLKHGVFNLGFIGVRNTEEGRRFADWWSERTYHLCRADVPGGLFTDQKWINLAPIFFDGVGIIKSSRHNVATWNLSTRQMTGTREDGFFVDGEPLGFYHFTGFDSGAHRIMATKYASRSPAVQQLVSWYEAEVAVADSDPISQWPWAYGRFTNGLPIAPAHRRLYRDHRDLQIAFRDPYDAEPRVSTFLEWCDSEGKLRYPKQFGEFGGNGAELPRSTTLPFGAGLRIFLLMMAPARGRPLRAKLREVLRREGLGGIARRVRWPR